MNLALDKTFEALMHQLVSLILLSNDKYSFSISI